MYAIMDTETTGLKPEFDQFYQISVILSTDRFQIEEVVNLYCTPTVPFSPGAVKATGVNMQVARMLSKGKNVIDIKQELILLINKLNKRTVVGHNVNYDIAIVNNTIGGLNIQLCPKSTLDTMHIYKNLLNLPRKGGGIKFPALGEVEKYLNTYYKTPMAEIYTKLFKERLNLHDSRYDTFITYNAIRHYKLTLEPKV